MKVPRKARFGLWVVVCCLVVFAVQGALEAFSHGFRGAEAVRLVASFACFGILFGGVVAFDPLPGEKAWDKPLLRFGLGALAGACLGLVWHWPGDGLALSGLVGGMLGYLGLTWAKHL